MANQASKEKDRLYIIIKYCHTSFSLGNKTPVNHPWFHCTKKLKEEYTIWKIFILKARLNKNQSVSICVTIKILTYGFISFLVYLEAVHLRGSTCLLHFIVSPVQNVSICNFFTLRVRSQVFQELKHRKPHELPQKCWKWWRKTSKWEEWSHFTEHNGET